MDTLLGNRLQGRRQNWLRFGDGLESTGALHAQRVESTRKWTAGKSHPGITPLGSLLVAGRVSCRWTSSPFCLQKGPSENRTRSPSLQERNAASTPTDRHVFSGIAGAKTDGLLSSVCSLPTDSPGLPKPQMAQEGFEPSASLVLSESGLPVAYRAFFQFRALESNQRPPRSKRGVTSSSNCPGRVHSGRRIRTSTT
jgi:hypothetical protein